MDCRTVHDHLSTYLDRELPQQTRAMLDEHFEACPTCRTTLAQLEAVTTWVGDWPRIEPSAAFLQQVCERVERLPQPSRVGLFHRLAGALPLQAAAALMVVVSAAVVWQVTPSLWRGQEQETAPPARVEPWLSDERRVTPVLDAPPSIRRSKSRSRCHRRWCRYRPDIQCLWHVRSLCGWPASFRRCHR